MANLRSSVTMTDDEVETFIRDRRTATLATIGKDGRPHLASMWFTVLEGEIVMHTKSKSQKAVNIRRDPRVTVLLEAGTSYEELRGVSLDGTAEIIEDPDYLTVVGSSVMQRYSDHPDSSDATPEELAALDRQLRNRVSVVVHVTRTRSWDHRKLGLPS